MAGRLVTAALVLMVAFAAWSLLANRPASLVPGTTGLAFDPEQVSELEIKGLRPEGRSSWAALEAPAAPEFTPELVARGGVLYAKACAGCHGNDGKGEGPVAQRFDMPSAPADLSQPLGSVKIRSTFPGSPPLPEDLFRTLTRGLPGTSMWSYRHLPPADRWALIAHLRTLSPDYTAQKAEPAALPAKLPNDAAIREIGAATYTATCQNCHGALALGSAVELQDLRAGKPYLGLRFARDGGTQMLGGGSDEDIARTLMTGFHRRSPMMSFKNFIYTEKDPSPDALREMDRRFWGIVFYTRELLKAQEARTEKP